MVALALFKHKASSTVLDSLKTSQLVGGDSRKTRIAIVESSGDGSVDKGGSGLHRKKGADRRDLS